MLKGLLKSLVGDAGNIIDEVVTSKEEKIALKNAMKKMLLDSEADLQKNVTDRWKADMASDSWLSKNVRPVVLLFLIVCTMLLIFVDAGFLSFTVEGVHPHDIATILDETGVAIRAGHHCCQILHDKLGIPASARASLGVYNTKDDLDKLNEGINNCKKIFDLK